MALLPDIHTEVIGSDSGPITFYDSDPSNATRLTIVLFHGTSGSAESSYWALFPMLSMRHRVVAFDFVDPADAPTSDHYLAQAEAVVLAAASGGPVHVVGYSFGAVIAAQFAARRPELVRSLVLVAGWIKTDAHQLLRNDVWQMLRDSSDTALAAFSLLTFFSAGFINSKNPSEIAALVEGLKRGADRSVKMRFNRDVDITAEIGRITAPTLVVGCTHDFMVPIRHSRLLFGGIANSRFVEVSAGHGIAQERPSELFALIHAFVRNPDGHPAGSVIGNDHA